MAGLARRTSRKRPTIGSTRPGSAAAAGPSLRQKGKSTPASIPAAIPSGISAISRPSGRSTPLNAISAPARRNAPTPSAMVMPLVAAISAAPGVLQARTTGTRAQALSSALPAALARQIASTQLAVWAGVASRAAAAASTSTMVEP